MAVELPIILKAFKPPPVVRRVKIFTVGLVFNVIVVIIVVVIVINVVADDIDNCVSRDEEESCEVERLCDPGAFAVAALVLWIEVGQTWNLK